MGVHSGKFGVVDGISTVRDWNIVDTMTAQRFGASNTLWGKGSRPGIHSWNGGFNVFGASPAVMPGDQFSFLGYTAPNNNGSGPGVTYDGDALVEQLQVNWNWTGGEIINSNVTFQGHLELTTNQTGDEITDETCPDVPEIAGAKIMVSLEAPWSEWVEWDNLMTATLTVSCELKSFVNSGTIITNRIWTGHQPGPIDWTLSVTEQDTRRNFVNKGQRIAVRLYVNENDYFELKWVQVNEFTDLSVNRETGDIMQQTINATMDGIDSSVDPCQVGHLLLPSGDQWWPFDEVAPTTVEPTTT